MTLQVAMVKSNQGISSCQPQRVQTSVKYPRTINQLLCLQLIKWPLRTRHTYTPTATQTTVAAINRLSYLCICFLTTHCPNYTPVVPSTHLLFHTLSYIRSHLHTYFATYATIVPHTHLPTYPTVIPPTHLLFYLHTLCPPAHLLSYCANYTPIVPTTHLLC